MVEIRWTTVTSAADVTEEILEAAEGIYDGWFADEARIDWVDFFDRLDGITMADNSRLDLGENMLSAALKKIRAHIRAYAKAGGGE